MKYLITACTTGSTRVISLCKKPFGFNAQYSLNRKFVANAKKFGVWDLNKIE